MPINFTVNWDDLTNDVDDDTGDIGTTPVVGPVWLVPQFREGARALAPDYSPRPTSFPLRTFTGFLDSDGQLKNAAGGTPGMRVWANDPVFNLERLPYRVEAELTDVLGRPIPWTPFIFNAPATDTVVNLVTVMPVATASGEGLTQGPRGYGITGDYLGTVGSAAAMTALTGGAVGDWVIRSDTATIWVVVALPISTAANWAELSYPSVDAVTVAGIVDATAIGRAMLTAADGPAEVALIGAEATANKGIANGYASLDSGGKIPAGQLPSSIMDYKGVWNASTNTPTLVDGTGSTGDVYRVTVAGSQNLGSGSITFDVGDYAIYNGTAWEKSDTTDAVASVAGKTGIVTLVKADVGLGNVDNTSDATKNAATAALTNKDLTSGTNTFPTFNQNTTGSAAKLTTARNIDGQAFDGTADITVIAPGTHAATSKTTPVAADEIPLVDSAASNTLKKLAWSNLEAKISAQTVFNVKNYGAVGDGSTDDKAAIQAAVDAAQAGGGGTVYFPPAQYRIASSINIRQWNIQLVGSSKGGAQIIITSAAAAFDAITFTGYTIGGVPSTPTDNSTFPWNFKIQDLWLEKTSPVANGSAAINLFCVQNVQLNNIHIRGFGTGVVCSAAYNVMADRVSIQSNSAATYSPLYGWKFDSTYPNFSSFLSHCFVAFGGENIDPGSGTVITTYGFSNTGTHPSDWFLDHCEADRCTYGFYYDAASAATVTDTWDIHFVGCVADQCRFGFTVYNNLTPGATGGQVDFDSCYWTYRYTTESPAPSGVGISIYNSSGVTIRGLQGFSGNPANDTLYKNNYGVLIEGNSRDVSVTGCNLKGNHVNNVFVNGAKFVTIFGNTICQTLSNSSNGIALVNAQHVSIAGNTIRSITGLSVPIGTGIYIDSTSNNVTVSNNVVDTSTVTAPFTIIAGGSAIARGNIGFADV